jgi:tetratricopeptide (TPR) repeat protein
MTKIPSKPQLTGRLFCLLGTILCSTLGIYPPALGEESITVGEFRFEEGRSYRQPPVVVPATSLPVRLQRDGRTLNYTATVSDEGIEIQLSAAGEALVFPWTGLDYIVISLVIPETTVMAMNHRDAVVRVERLRPFLDSFLALARAPARSTNVHDPLAIYLRSLLELGRRDEALELIRKLPLDRVSEVLADAVYQTAQSILADGQQGVGMDLLQDLHSARSKEEFTVKAVALARRLAEQRHLTSALMLFQPLIEIAPAPIRAELALRGSYLALEADREDDFQVFVRLQQRYAQHTPEESAVRTLIEGYASYRNGLYDQALSAFGQVLNLLAGDSPWREIALFHNHETYRAKGRESTALSIQQEMELLFPDGAYTAALLQRQSVPALPPAPAVP